MKPIVVVAVAVMSAGVFGAIYYVRADSVEVRVEATPAARPLGSIAPIPPVGGTCAQMHERCQRALSGRPDQAEDGTLCQLQQRKPFVADDGCANFMLGMDALSGVPEAAAMFGPRAESSGDKRLRGMKEALERMQRGPSTSTGRREVDIEIQMEEIGEVMTNAFR